MFVLEQSSMSFHYFVANDRLQQQVVEVSDSGVEEIIEKEQREKVEEYVFSRLVSLRFLNFAEFRSLES